VGLGSAIFLLRCGLQMIILHTSIFLLKLNLITIDSDCSSGFDSAYYSCWCMLCGQIGSLLYRRPYCHVIADVHVISYGVGG
jgi:hypothetical protein